VIEHVAGLGRHKGRLGALVIELPNGTTFNVGTGFSDAEREAPPPVGTVITFRYQELSDGGVPRFPSFVGQRIDMDWAMVVAQAGVAHKKVHGAGVSGAAGRASPLAQPASAPVPTPVAKQGRTFEFSDGESNKFWQITVDGASFTTRYGKQGSAGQTTLKTFATPAVAKAEADKLIAEKTRKGYLEKPS
jgi:DNA ligase-1